MFNHRRSHGGTREERLTRRLPGCPGAGAAPPCPPLWGDRHPPGSAHLAAGWERSAGGGPRFPALPSLPRDRSVRTPEGTQTPAPVCPRPGLPAGHRPGEVGRWARGTRPPEPLTAPRRQQTSPHSLPKSSSLRAPHCPLQAAPHPKTPSRDRQLGTLQHRGAARPQPRTTPSPLGCHAWPPPPEEMPSPAASLPPGALRTPVPSPSTRTWFMTLPKSIRGLACLHPKGTAPQPHLARGARGRPGGGRRAAGEAGGGRREPGVAQAGRRESKLQAEPPSLPGPSLEKEGRKEGGRREGREGGGEPKGFAPRKRDPGDGGAQGGPVGRPLPSAPPGRPGAGDPGGAGPGPGEEGGPGRLFPPLPSLLSLLLPLSSPLPSLPSCTARSKSSPAPLPSPPPKTPLKATGSPVRAASPGQGVLASTQTPPKNTPPPCTATTSAKCLAPCTEGPQQAAGRSRVGALSPRVTPPVSPCPWRGGVGTGMWGPPWGLFYLAPPGTTWSPCATHRTGCSINGPWMPHTPGVGEI